MGKLACHLGTFVLLCYLHVYLNIFKILTPVLNDIVYLSIKYYTRCRENPSLRTSKRTNRGHSDQDHAVEL